MEPFRVLAADDEIAVRQVAIQSLRGLSMHVAANEDAAFLAEEAASVEEAFAAIRKQPPDILLLGDKLSGVGVCELLDRIAALRLDMLTIVLAGVGSSLDTAVAAVKHGAYDVLSKPVSPDQLKTAILKAATQLFSDRQARRSAADQRPVHIGFVGMLGHELKSPLNAVTGYLELMKKRPFGDQLAAYGEMIDRSLARIEGMNRLIGDLLDWTRTESGRASRTLAPVDLAAAARSAVEAVRAEALRRNIVLRVHAADGLSLAADAGEIDAIFNNLLSNAVKYNRDGGSVDVAVTRDGGQVAIAVSDSGIGMTPDEVGRLFGEFVRIKNEKTRGIPGTGLGLSIVQRIAQLYGGDVHVGSRPGVGSVFTVTLHG